MEKLSICIFTLLTSISVKAQWSRISSMETIRKDHILFTYTNGKALAAGGWTGSENLQTSEWFEYSSLDWNYSSNELSDSHTSGAGVVLSNGKALIIGGKKGTVNTATCELYDTNTHRWSVTGSLNEARSHHTATLLANRRVLVTGGFNGTVNLSSCELFDPITNTWSLVPGGLTTARSHHTSTLLDDGRVLIVGGFNPDAGFQLNSVEIYNPATNSFSPISSLANSRAYHGSTKLSNGQVLVAGGERFTGNSPFAFEGMTSCEIFDPTTNSWSTAAEMPVGAAYNQLISIANDEVLMIAGARNTNYLPLFSFSPATSLIYKTETNSWVENPMSIDGRIGYAAAKWSDEKVIVTGGIGQNAVELFSTSFATKLKTSQNKLVIQVCPVPSSGLFTVKTDLRVEEVAFQISDLWGKSILIYPTYDGKLWQFDLSNQPKGMYRIAVLKDGKTVANQPILIH